MLDFSAETFGIATELSRMDRIVRHIGVVLSRKVGWALPTDDRIGDRQLGPAIQIMTDVEWALSTENRPVDRPLGQAIQIMIESHFGIGKRRVGNRAIIFGREIHVAHLPAGPVWTIEEVAETRIFLARNENPCRDDEREDARSKHSIELEEEDAPDRESCTFFLQHSRAAIREEGRARRA
jgi:hypothetical protein